MTRIRSLFSTLPWLPLFAGGIAVTGCVDPGPTSPDETTTEPSVRSASLARVAQRPAVRFESQQGELLATPGPGWTPVAPGLWTSADPRGTKVIAIGAEGYRSWLAQIEPAPATSPWLGAGSSVVAPAPEPAAREAISQPRDAAPSSLTTCTYDSLYIGPSSPLTRFPGAAVSAQLTCVGPCGGPPDAEVCSDLGCERSIGLAVCTSRPRVFVAQRGTPGELCRGTVTNGGSTVTAIFDCE